MILQIMFFLVSSMNIWGAASADFTSGTVAHLPEQSIRSLYVFDLVLRDNLTMVDQHTVQAVGYLAKVLSDEARSRAWKKKGDDWTVSGGINLSYPGVRHQALKIISQWGNGAKSLVIHGDRRMGIMAQCVSRMTFVSAVPHETSQTLLTSYYKLLHEPMLSGVKVRNVARINLEIVELTDSQAKFRYEIGMPARSYDGVFMLPPSVFAEQLQAANNALPASADLNSSSDL